MSLLKATFAVQYEMNLNEFHIIMDVSRSMDMMIYQLNMRENEI